MRRRVLGAAAAACVLLLGVPRGAVLAQSAPAADAALLERGRYLVEVAAACGVCHTTRGPDGAPRAGMEQAGGRVFAERGFRAVAPNITPDPETGIGRWTDAQIADAIRNGRRPDGSLIGPPMPAESYRDIADRDLAAMVAYLRTIPPVRHAMTERSTYSFPLTPHGPPVASVPDPPETDPVARGAYLAVNLAHCMDCHSAQLSEGRRDPARPGATGLVLEGPWGVVVARNISAHPDLGIGRWTDAQVLDAITRGVSADGRRLAPPMGGRAPIWARLTERDRRDLLAYIRSLPPQEP
jgi:mono/diheme cytochrome c family protein